MNKNTIINFVLQQAKTEVLINIPDLRQSYDYDCGTTALQSVLGYYGDDIREEILLKELGTNSDIGTDSHKMITYAKKLGYVVKEFEKMSLDDLKNWLKKGYPIILAIQAWSDIKDIDYSKTDEEGHYVVAIGFGDGKIYFEDPSLIGKGFLKENEFMERWKDYDAGTGKKLIRYGIILTGKKPKFNEDPEDFIHIDDD